MSNVSGHAFFSTAVVTGVSTSIGALYADRLVGRGDDLVLIARNAERRKRRKNA